MKNNLLAPVLALFVENGPHTANLVHSAVIELLDFIRVVRLVVVGCCVNLQGIMVGLSSSSHPLVSHNTIHQPKKHPQEHLRGLVEYLVERFRDQVTELGTIISFD